MNVNAQPYTRPIDEQFKVTHDINTELAVNSVCTTLKNLLLEQQTKLNANSGATLKVELEVKIKEHQPAAPQRSATEVSRRPVPPIPFNSSSLQSRAFQSSAYNRPQAHQ